MINLDRHICRAKDINTGEWVYGYYFERKDIMGNIIESVIIEDAYEQIHGGRRLLESMFNKECFRVDPETVCQCTGVPDKKGKMLFEHDIVKMRSYNRGCHETEVYFKNGKFAVDGSHYGFKDICSNSVEFVRNKFDNPELLEVQNEM